MNYQGTIIKESLEDNSLLEDVLILSTKIEPVNEKHQTPWLRQWTLHRVEIQEQDAERLAEVISKKLDYSHGGAWYADYKNDKFHFIIYKGKVFKVSRDSKEDYQRAKQYGVSLGIPEYQVNFSPEIKI
jgi:hypothetical protein